MEFSQPNLNMLKKKIIIIHAHLYTGKNMYSRMHAYFLTSST